MTVSESKLVYHISIKGMVINLLLFAVKGVTALLIHSVSLLSDAVHSLTDIISTAIVMVGIKISCKPADKSHPYGHDKIECMIAFLLGLMLLGVGASIGWQGIQKLYRPTEMGSISYILNSFALGAALVSIVAKEWMYRFTIRCARQVGSASMAADAWHHRSDAISSIGSLVGVLGIRFNLVIIDVLACLAISAFIFKAAYDICADACKRMIDTAGDYAVVNSIEHIILNHKDVLSLDVLKTRQFGSKLYVDVEVTLDRSMSFEHSHKIAHSIHDNIENTVTEVKHCMVHVNPSN